MPYDCLFYYNLAFDMQLLCCHINCAMPDVGGVGVQQRVQVQLLSDTLPIRATVLYVPIDSLVVVLGFARLTVGCPPLHP